MSQMFGLKALRWCIRISRLGRLDSMNMQNITRRSFSLSLERYVPLLDWVFGVKNDVPCAKAVPDTQEIHGFVLKDEFNWLRNPNSQAVKKYIKDENRYIEVSLEDTGFFQRQLVREMNHWLPLSHELESVPEQIDHHIYYVKSAPEGDNRLPVICRRVIFKSGSPGLPQIILNQNELAAKYPHVSVSNFKLSPSRQLAAFELDNTFTVADTFSKTQSNFIFAQLAAFSLDSTGLETYSCHITKVWDGPLDVMDIIPNAINFEWGGDDTTIFYTTCDQLKRSNKLWKHTLGEDVDKDVLMYEEINERFFLDVSSTKDRKYITVNSNAKATSEVSLISLKDHSFTHQPFFPREQGTEYYVEHRGKEFFILTNTGGFNYRVVRVDESNPVKESCQDIIPEEPNVFIDDMEVFQNYCVVYERRLTSPRLSIISLDDPDDVHFVYLPLEICSLVPGSNQTFKTDIVRFHISSPIVPPQVMEYDMSTGLMKELHPVLSRKPKYSSSDYECIRTEVPSKDGTMVPITLFHHKHVKKNGKNPMLLCVYGAYGMNVDMSFTLERLCLLSRGWVLAFCHVRGGGEVGREWYHQGKLHNKHKSFEDFEACTKNLHDMGYSNPSLTAAMGTSAGGLVVGAVCNRSPELFKAVILKVPFLDILTTMLDSSLPLTSQEYDEWGNPRTNEEDFNYIKSYCPYHNITKKNYPSVLVYGSMKDNRVPYWVPLKWVAKMRKELKQDEKEIKYPEEQKDSKDTTSTPLLLCTIDEDRGHFGSTSSQTVEELAREYAFLYRALGLPLK